MNYSQFLAAGLGGGGSGSGSGSGASSLANTSSSAQLTTLVNQYPEDAYPSRTSQLVNLTASSIGLRMIDGNKTIATTATATATTRSGALIDNGSSSNHATIRNQSEARAAAGASIVIAIERGQTLVGRIGSAALDLIASAAAAAATTTTSSSTIDEDDGGNEHNSDDFYLDEERQTMMIASQTTATTTTLAPLVNFATVNSVVTLGPPPASSSSSSSSSSSFSDWWNEYWSRQPFPSGYTQSSITLLACLITTIIFLIVVGNCLVCIAIFTEKSLKPTQNWFIASLAVSDMLLGLVVMPFSLARELMGFWVFGPLWCDIHEAVDVLLTTASINTLCLISLDRYWSITQAVSYLKKRTPRRGAFMIAFVWVFSAAVSLPPLFGWKKQSPNVTGPALPLQQNGASPPPPSAFAILQKQQINNNNNSSSSNSISSSKNRTTLPEVVKQRAQFSNGGEDFLIGQQEAGGGAGGGGGETQQHWRRKRRRTTPLTLNRKRRTAASNKQQRALQPASPPLGHAPDSSAFQASRRQSSNYDFMVISSDNQNYLQQQQQQQRQQRQAYNNYANLLMQQQQDLQQQQMSGANDGLAASPLPASAAAAAAAVNEYPTCQLSDDIGYVLYSALGSFYIPCAVMVFTYIKIFLAARSRARRTINKQSRGTAGQAGASEKAKQRAASAKESAAAAAAAAASATTAAAAANSRRTIAGATSGPRSSSKPLNKSSLTTLGRLRNCDQHNDSELDDESVSAICVETAGASCGQIVKAKQQVEASGGGGGGDKLSAARRQSIAKGSKVVVVGRRKSTVMAQQQQQQQQPIVALATTYTRTLQEVPIVESSEVLRDEPETCATLITSGAKHATSSVLSAHSGGPQLAATVAGAAAESSLITVMSESMSELPVTRFNFKRDNDVSLTNKQQGQDDSDNNNNSSSRAKVAALLEAITSASKHVDANEKLIREISGADDNDGDGTTSERIDCDNATSGDHNVLGQRRHIEEDNEKTKPLTTTNNATNETCFLNMEEDSDNLDAQTGRTILMLATATPASARSLRAAGPKSALAAAAAAAAAANSGSIKAGEAATGLLLDNSTTICNNVACIRRRRQRQRAARAGGSSYCSSSMTINDDDDDDDDNDDNDEDDDDEEEEDDDDDGCLEDELLTDDCNGSCGLDQFCSADLNCVQCGECAAFVSGAKLDCGGGSGADSCNDSPGGGCQLSTPYESPARIFSGGASSNQKQHQHAHSHSHHNRHNRHHNHSQNHSHHQHNQQQQAPINQQQQHPLDNCSQVIMNMNSNKEDIETQSLTSEDNLSLTDYRSNYEDDEEEEDDDDEDGEVQDDEDEDDEEEEEEEDAHSSIVGHDMLDASPAVERPHSAAAAAATTTDGGVFKQRRSIVASALASVASGAVGGVGGRHSTDKSSAGDVPNSTANAHAVARKKGSIAFRLARLGSSAPAAPASLSNQTGGLLALAAASQQQQQYLVGATSAAGTIAPQPAAAAATTTTATTTTTTTRNLKTLRQNFFHKLNQLTAKSAASAGGASKQQRSQKSSSGGGGKSRSPPNGKSSAHSSYGSSYEPSIDCATTSNVHSNNDHYQGQETTFGETDDTYDQQVSACDTGKQSSCCAVDTMNSIDDVQQQRLLNDTDHQIDSNCVQHQTSKQLHSNNNNNNNNNSTSQNRLLEGVQAAALINHIDQNSSVARAHHNQNHCSGQLAHHKHNQRQQQQQQQRDNNESPAASNKQLPSTTTTDDDSMLIQHSTTTSTGNNRSLNNELDLGQRSSQQANRRIMSSSPNAVAIIGSKSPAVINKKRSTDRGVGGNQAGAGFGGGGAGHGSGNNNNNNTGSGGARSGNTASTSRTYLASDNERHKRKLAKARERRATLILGLIMAAFICSWLPFFTFYVIRALCHVCRDYISPRFEAFIFWMGYCNSAINPIIYTIFNRDFRKAFRKILFKCL